MAEQTHRYFAIPDPLDPVRMTYWALMIRPRRGRKEGDLVPWPPGTSYGPSGEPQDVPGPFEPDEPKIRSARP